MEERSWGEDDMGGKNGSACAIGKGKIKKINKKKWKGGVGEMVVGCVLLGERKKKKKHREQTQKKGELCGSLFLAKKGLESWKKENRGRSPAWEGKMGGKWREK